MHRIIVGAKKGDIVDHINGNKLDNRRSNLRFATHGQNAQNAKKDLSPSGFIGVHKDGPYLKVGIKVHGKRRHLGMFKTAIEAAIRYDNEALKVYGPEARTNLKYFENIVLQLKRGKKT